MVEYRVSLMKIVTLQRAKTTTTISSRTKPPSAHLATNQKSEAKQKLGGRMKKPTTPVATRRTLTITRQMTVVHLPLEGNGLVLRARKVISNPKTS